MTRAERGLGAGPPLGQAPACGPFGAGARVVASLPNGIRAVTVSAATPFPVDGPAGINASQQARDDMRYQQLVDRLVAPGATPEQRDLAYDLVAAQESGGQLTDAALTQAGAQAIADSRAVPVQVAEVAPLVPPGTALGPFASADAAAIEMMHYSNPLSIEANLENGGLVFEGADGQYFISTPMGGTLDGFNPGQVPQPEGMALEGAYHGHADYTDANGNRTDKANDVYNSDHFSQQDKRVADGGYWGPVIYVSTPSGDFRKYDSATKQDTLIHEGTRFS